MTGSPFKKCTGLFFFKEILSQLPHNSFCLHTCLDLIDVCSVCVKEAVMKNVKMVGVALFLLLLTTSTCCGFGFKRCSQNYPQTDVMWCSNKHIVNLSEVVSMIPDNITTIVLTKNKIRDIPTGTFAKLNRLKSLNLGQNELPSLKGGEFTGLDLLSVLNLTYNNISQINSDAFAGLASLKILLLTNNRLAGNLSLLFKLLPAIEEVYLSFNMLESFSCGESGGSSTLRHLDLFANKIRTLNVSCFPGLKYIQLSNNTDLQLQPDVFASNPKLRALHLQAVQVEMLVGLSAQTKRNLSEVSFSLSVEKSPWTICGVLKEMKHLRTVKVRASVELLPFFVVFYSVLNTLLWFFLFIFFIYRLT